MNAIKLYNCFVCETPCHTPCCLACQKDLPWVPYHCIQCQRAVKHPHSYCTPCKKNPSSFRYTIPLLYEAPIAEAIGAFKLGQQEYLCEPLAQLFVDYFISHLSDNDRPDVLIPVPSHPKRIWQRGYNPALLITRQLGKRLQLPVNDKAVKRIRHTPPQRLQTKQERSRNLMDAFETVKLNPDWRVALVDDVVTTGETLRALAQVVAPSVKNVVFWAIAESPARNSTI